MIAIAAALIGAPVFAQEVTPTSENTDPFATAAPAETPAPSEAPAAPAASTATISDAITGGHLLFEARARYEFAEQSNRAHEAGAATLRTRLGWETDSWNDWRGLVEFEDVRQIGGYDYYDGLHPHGGVPAPHGGYPQVSDPEGTELNRAQLTWTPSPAFQATLGRQRITFDDQRFIGNVGWRQDEQTYDAARLDAGFGNLRVAYAYVGQVNRIFSDDLDWDSQSHLLNATYAFSEPLRVTGFAYLLDFNNSAANSSASYGLRATGRTWAGLIGVNYALTYATQEDYANNPAHFDLDYLGAELSGQYDIYTLRLAYELLEGNGARGFSTPLATLHAFQGWADLFLTTPANGITDTNVQLNIRPRFRRDHFFNIDLTGRWHDFEYERTGGSIGGELDLQANAAITTRFSVGAKYADFNSDTAAYPDTTRAWLTAEYRF